MAQAIALKVGSWSLTALGEQTFEEHGVLLRNLTGTLDRVEINLQVLERASSALALNSTSLQPENVIYLLLVPDGHEPVDFPGTVAELRALTNAQLRQSLEDYNLVAPAGSKAARLEVLMEHMGLPGAA
ncbi:hypothetical protein FRC06_011897 [Ceratobasidium sp. 370]|nr:hypothetical protein FRC06_011897 [Ceratobasidium sp. 370]